MGLGLGWEFPLRSPFLWCARNGEWFRFSELREKTLGLGKERRGMSEENEVGVRML